MVLQDGLHCLTLRQVIKVGEDLLDLPFFPPVPYHAAGPG